ncbi:hypothetical protein IJ843_08095 [bacterium]|nr:hypothetical protein [bacterium]
MEDIFAQLDTTTTATQIIMDMLMHADENWDLYNKERFTKEKGDEIMAMINTLNILLNHSKRLQKICYHKYLKEIKKF